MIRTIEAAQVEIGMYVILPTRWVKRLIKPTEEYQFLIENKD